MVGDCGHSDRLRSLGFASAASPAPKVFCSLEGRESFANRYFLDWTDREGKNHSLPVDHSLLARLRGPEARRSMYLLTLEGDSTGWTSLNHSIRHYALCGPLMKEWGIDADKIQWPVMIRVVPVDGTQIHLIPYGEPCP